MIKKKKIAILCNYELLPERIGGMDYFFWLYDKKHKENNISIDWFFPNSSNHGDYGKLTIKESNYQNIETYFLKQQLENKEEYSHIVTHFIELCTPFFYKIKQVSNAKIIAIDHNPRPIQGYPIKKLIEKKVKGILFSKYIDLFVGVSDYSKNQLFKDFGTQIKDKSSVIFNGLEIKKFDIKTNFNIQNRFIVASHLRKEKGIQDLIIAVRDLDEHLKIDLNIDIYGNGNYEQELKNMIDIFSLNNIFKFKGNVSNLNQIYCNYDYLIHPSHGETFCYSVVESLLSNLPVITTRNQGNVLGLVQESVNGYLFEANQSNELKNILKKIINLEVHISDFSTKNEKVNNLSLEKMVEDHFKLIQ